MMKRKMFKNEMIEKMYNVFSQFPLFWEIDAITCRATKNSPYRLSLIDNLNIKENSHILDVACGTGLNFHLLQSKIGKNGKITGIDNSEKTLKLAQKRVMHEKWNNVDLIKTNASDYRTDLKVDAALCTFAIEIIPPFKDTINTMLNTVKSKGRIGLLGFKSSTHPFFKFFNSCFEWVSVPIGGVDLKRNVPQYLRDQCKEVFYKEVFGGFYYIAVYEKH